MARLLTLAVACAAFAAASPAIAQSSPGGAPGDQAPAEGPIRSRDHGGPPSDGSPPRRQGGLFISPSGEPFHGPDGERRWFDGADANHDGVLTLEEFKADAMRFFKVLDTNGDGVIDGFENEAYETKIVPEITNLGIPEDNQRAAMEAQNGEPSQGRHGRGGGRRGGGGGPPSGGGGRRGQQLEGAARYSLLNEPQPVRGADFNLDFKVSRAEWDKAAERRFALLDAKATGRIAFDDLPGRHHVPPKSGDPRHGEARPDDHSPK